MFRMLLHKRMEYFAFEMETSISLFFNCLFSFAVCKFPVLFSYVGNTTYGTLYSERSYMKRVDNFAVGMETSQFPCLFVFFFLMHVSCLLSRVGNATCITLYMECCYMKEVDSCNVVYSAFPFSL